MADASSKRYDENQTRAIEASDGYFLVLAPPGCGKTDILAERIARAHERGVAFDQMLCLTFTNRASRGMRDRISQRVGDDACKDLFVGNVHRFCSRYLYDNHVVSENISIIDEDDQSSILGEIDPRLFISRNGPMKEAIRTADHLAAFILQSQLGHKDETKSDDLGFETLYRIARQHNFDADAIPAEKALLAATLRYMDYKRAHSILDFSEILVRAYDHMIHNPDHKRFSWIQVDEVQDLNTLQMAIVDELTAEEPTVMYLGDEQQAIFSFMGAKLSTLEMLKQRCKNNLLTLGNNYRAPDYLLEVCNQYAISELGVDPAFLPKPTTNAEKGKHDLLLVESQTVDDERARVLKMVQYYLNIDEQERLAILVTRNDDADRISRTLTENGVPNFKVSGTDMFRQPAYKTLVLIYCVLVNDFNLVAWARLLYGVDAISRLMESREMVYQMRSMMLTPSDLMEKRPYVDRFHEAYTRGEMVVFDTETTGLNVMEDDIVQIAAFKVVGGRKVEGSEFNVIMHTDRPIPDRLGDKVNPLVEEYARREHLSRKEGLQMFLDYAGTLPLVGHNVAFDYQILRHNVERELSEAVEYNVFDTLHIIKCVKPDLHRYNLESLLEELNLQGENSHLADEDILATKSLIDWCVERIAEKASEREAFLNRAKVRNIASRMDVLKPIMENIRAYLYTPISHTHHTIADELYDMYNLLRNQNLIDDLGDKFNTFLKYINAEWVDPTVNETLFDQILTHVHDITSSINEGDLVNSSDLLQDRVFIMTVYKAKGLEFGNVVVLNAIDGTYPFYMVNRVLSNPNSSPAQRAMAIRERNEDARKFYVAISRASKRLCISYTRQNSNGYPVYLTPFMQSIKHLFFSGKNNKD